MRIVPTILLLPLALCSAQAAEVMTAAQATAVFDTIRTTPAQRKLHCEQLQLQRASVDAYLSRDNAAASSMGVRNAAIQSQLAGYKPAFAFYSDKAGDRAFYDSTEGKALDRAQKALDASCPTPRIQR